MSTDISGGSFDDAALEGRAQIETRLKGLLEEHAEPEDIRTAMGYSLLSGGKRLRPLLCVWTHDALKGQNRGACIDVACALECLHTYSLVHDDLPCMDDDDMRRGQPSCHKKFGEAMAVLVGDALLTMCFDILARLSERWGVDHGTVVEMLGIIAKAAGRGGLIAGQVLDLASDRLDGTIEAVDRIHLHKTAALISASMEAGAVLSGADEGTRERVAKAGLCAGRAFQIVDDVLDMQMDGETLGKTPGKDAKDSKLTYPSVVGVEESRKKAAALVEEARTELGPVAVDTRLGGLLDLIVKRSK